MSRLAIINYGAGNIYALRRSLEWAGADVTVDPAPGDGCAGLVLPGVGNFDQVMSELEPYRKMMESVPVLGICVGMQAFYGSSQEGRSPGLGVMRGAVVRLPASKKSPHMGWNTISVRRPGRLLEGVAGGSWVYYTHSYMAESDGGPVTAVSEYGVDVPAVVEQGNYYGTQFHPEKSGAAGRRILENFVGVCGR
ncbi:MAG: imidazole glycerol phosphate synthase subunit HisH [Nitrosopumilus sp.]|nr:imidazole glycerol phosphate synthase subunit HisH [Nitrosopumilus sp.]